MNTGENSQFYNAFSNSKEPRIKSLIDEILEFTGNYSAPIYLLNQILGNKNKFSYDLQDVVYLVIPNYPILLIFDDNHGEEEQDIHLEDLKEDLGQLSVKYKYNNILGRPRTWNCNWFELQKWNQFDFQEFLKNKKLSDETEVRKIELIISLITGSINDIDKVGSEIPSNLLDSVKRQILLFDGTQSHFIFDKDEQDLVFIQGMAGTGKTELFMRKIKELYVSDEKPRIAFTCHNKVLASEMKYRIERFFNFMKVEEQIDWDNRLKVFHAWGALNNEQSGLYRLICRKYDLDFLNLSQAGTFDNACKKAIEQLDEKGIKEYIFDYIFIDECQDFEESFFELCKKVCSNIVYIAGDIFQSIFEEPKNLNLQADYTLNKCYRTDPRTLMFAHAIGMGLYEKPPLNWLKDEEWETCGYKITNNPTFSLTRSPLRRFDNLQSKDSIILDKTTKNNLEALLIDCINKIKINNPTVTPDDIGIIVLGQDFNSMAIFSYLLGQRIEEVFSWNSTIGFEAKQKVNNSVFISNENNVKGLDFPFTITVLLSNIGNSTKLRNSLYMSLTRSFITSYLVMNSDEVDDSFYNLYNAAAKDILNSGSLNLNRPSDKEIQEMKMQLSIQKETEKTVSERIDSLLSQKKYSTLNDTEINFIMFKVNSEWMNFTPDEILTKVKKLADSLI